jgi:hypothetical protein
MVGSLTPRLAFLFALCVACGTNQECLESVHDIEKGGDQARTHAAELVEQALGAHTAELAWQDGTRTELLLELSMAHASWVESRRHPDNHNDIAVDCRDRIRVRAHGALRTGDGRLDERFEAIALDEMQPSLLRARMRRRAGALQGRYVRQSQGGRLTGLNFEVQLGAELFRGSVHEEIESGDSLTETGALGSWGDQAPGTP